MNLLMSLHGKIWEFLHSFPICHHIPERSILFEYELPLCCRCTGLYSFFIFMFILNFFLKIGYSGSKKTLIIIILLPLIAGIEAMLELKFHLDPGNFIRFIMGSVSGSALGIILNIGLSRQKIRKGKKTPTN